MPDISLLLQISSLSPSPPTLHLIVRNNWRRSKCLDSPTCSFNFQMHSQNMKCLVKGTYNSSGSHDPERYLWSVLVLLDINIFSLYESVELTMCYFPFILNAGKFLPTCNSFIQGERISHLKKPFNCCASNRFNKVTWATLMQRRLLVFSFPLQTVQLAGTVRPNSNWQKSTISDSYMQNMLGFVHLLWILMLNDL